MQILDQPQIKRKIKRLALQVAENNLDAGTLYIGGINNNGKRFAAMLSEQINDLTSLQVIHFDIKLNPANPVDQAVQFSIEPHVLNDKNILIVDDVANTGRTLFYAFKPLMHIVPNQIEAAVLVDRKHKSFPVKVDYVGLSLSTTLHEVIDVRLHEEKLSAHLN